VKLIIGINNIIINQVDSLISCILFKVQVKWKYSVKNKNINEKKLFNNHDVAKKYNTIGIIIPKIK